MNKNDPKNIAICLFNTAEGVLLMLANDASIQGWESTDEAIAFWEKGWESTMTLGAGFAAGGILSWIILDPSIVVAPTLQWIVDNILDPEDMRPHKMGGLGVRTMLVAKARPEAKEHWEAGIKPKLAGE